MSNSKNPTPRLTTHHTPYKRLTGIPCEWNETNSNRTRTLVKPIEKGNNPYGRGGTRACRVCRSWKRTVTFSSIFAVKSLADKSPSASTLRLKSPASGAKSVAKKGNALKFRGRSLILREHCNTPTTPIAVGKSKAWSNLFIRSTLRRTSG